MPANSWPAYRGVRGERGYGLARSQGLAGIVSWVRVGVKGALQLLINRYG